MSTLLAGLGSSSAVECLQISLAIQADFSLDLVCLVHIKAINCQIIHIAKGPNVVI